MQMLLFTAYKIYLDRRKSGIEKHKANVFCYTDEFTDEFPDLTLADFEIASYELGRAGMVRKYVRGFRLVDQGVLYMENRFQDKVDNVLEWIAKIKSLLPFC